MDIQSVGIMGSMGFGWGAEAAAEEAGSWGIDLDAKVAMTGAAAETGERVVSVGDGVTTVSARCISESTPDQSDCRGKLIMHSVPEMRVIVPTSPDETVPHPWEGRTPGRTSTRSPTICAHSQIKCISCMHEVYEYVPNVNAANEMDRNKSNKKEYNHSNARIKHSVKK
jgi:hypothetical protein